MKPFFAILLACASTQTYSEFSIAQTLEVPTIPTVAMTIVAPTHAVPTITRTSVAKIISEGTSTPHVDIPEVPFYSQFTDITSGEWQKVGCGVTSLAMVVDYYKPAVLVDTLLKEGIALGAYDKNAGWTYKGLIGVSQKYGLDGKSYDLAGVGSNASLAELEKYVKGGPVIASVHYKFDPKSTIPHLVVIDAIKGDIVYYNDPAAKTGNKQISTDDFLKAWKKRFIVIRPAEKNKNELAFVQQ